MSRITKRILIGIFVAFIFWVLAQYLMATDFQAIGDYLSNSPLVLPTLIIVSLLGHVAGTIAWKLCMGDEGSDMALGELFFMRLVSENLAVFNPTNVIAGDGLKAIFLNRKNVPYQTAAKSVVLSRVLLIVAALVLMVISILYLMIRSADTLPWLIVTLLSLVGIGVSVLIMFLFLSKEQYLHRIVLRLQSTYLRRWISLQIVDQVKLLNDDLIDYYRVNSAKLFTALTYSMFHWICGALEFYVILHFFGVGVSMIDAVAIEMGVLGFKAAGSVVPGQIGVEEYGNKVMLGLIGVASIEIWVMVSLLRRARQLFWLGTAGIASIVLYKRYRIKTA